MEPQTKITVESNWYGVFIVLLFPIVGIFAWGTHETTLIDIIIILGIYALLFLVTLASKVFTYIEIYPNHTITNRREFKIKSFDVLDVVYVGRIFLSRAMFVFIFFKGKNGLIDYTAICEGSYTNKALLSVFTELRKFNKDLEINEEYELFLKDSYLDRGIKNLDIYREVKKKLEKEGYGLVHSNLMSELF